MAVMILLLLLINSFEGFSEAEHETLCASNACFTLHTDNMTFERANQSCFNNGGYLMTVRDREEEDVLRLLLSQTQRRDRGLKFWIGLKLHKGDCVLPDRTLKGFRWISGKEDSHYANWEREPAHTCTERCVRAHYTFSGQDQLKWTAGPCKRTTAYACKFYFKGMCKALALLGPGQITYTAAFSSEPLKNAMKSLPFGTFARIVCGDHESHSMCVEGDGQYRWSVPGPFCKTEEANCAINNGGCEHLCHQDEDSIRCSCNEGYDLEENKVFCRRKDLCVMNICEHQCVAGQSGYSCRCPDGFQLDANQRNCSDVDECQSRACQGHFCVNTRGGYECRCNGGYEMTGGECRDVDECAQSRCEHSCLNTLGSFSCYCDEGFALSEDGRSCLDVNECAGARCRFGCVNTVGSFSCTCPGGFRLDASGMACAPDVTAAPTDGPADKQTRHAVTESSAATTAELPRHPQLTGTDAPLAELANASSHTNASLVTSLVKAFNSRVLICVLGSVIPLLLLISVTLTIAIYRCSRSRKEAKKATTTDGYCWVSSGLDPRLEKLYESILTDDL